MTDVTHHLRQTLDQARLDQEAGRTKAATRLLMALGGAEAQAMLDAMAPTHTSGIVLAERLRFGPPETWRGWRPGFGAVSVKLWPAAMPELSRWLEFRHLGVAPVLAAGPGWAVSAWIEGTPLPAARPTLDDAARARILTELADALAALRAAGLAHGDLSPANVVLATDGRAVLIDTLENGAGTPGFGRDDAVALERLAEWLAAG
jgi:hypothetical protein